MSTKLHFYATNGRPYLKQLKDESGIWFWDSRKPLEHSRPLEGWHSPADLQMLLEQDDRDADKKLEEESIESLVCALTNKMPCCL